MTDFRPQLDETNSTIETMLTHHSVRSYSRQPVSEATLFSVLSAAQAAPSSSNQFSWSVIVVRDPARKEAVAELTGSNPFICEAPVFLVWLADLSRVNRRATREGTATEVFNYQESLLLGTVDAVLAAENAAVAAESMGLGTCYVGGIRSHIDAVAELLELPEYSFPVVGLTVGWPGEHDTAGIKPRLPLSSLAFAEKYDVEAADAGAAILDEEAERYNQSQGRPSRPWSTSSLRKWATTDSIKGRENNREVLIRRGFTDR